MAKRSGADLNQLAKNKKITLPFSTNKYLKEKILIGDSSA